MLSARLGEWISPRLGDALRAAAAADGATASVLAARELVRALEEEGTMGSRDALLLLARAVSESDADRLSPAKSCSCRRASKLCSAASTERCRIAFMRSVSCMRGPAGRIPG